MRRLITVFALIAALFVLMGCGMGSKGNQGPAKSNEQELNTAVEPISYSAPADGQYVGNSGEIFIADAKMEDIGKLLAKRQEKLDLLAKISEFEKKLEGISAEDTTAQEEINSVIGTDKESLASSESELVELEKLVAFHLTSMKFSISHDENNQYHISDLVIETREDKDVPELGEDGNPKKDDAGNDLMKKEHYFGDLNKITLSDVVSFDPKVGLSFSFKTGEADSELLYTFNGITSDRSIDNTEDKILKEVTLKGSIEIASKGEVHQYGNWSVSQTLDVTPEKVEEPKTDEALAPVESPKSE